MPFIRISVIAPPKTLFNTDKWVREISRVMHQKTAPLLKTTFKQTVEGWNKPPTFYAHHYTTTSSIGVQVYSRQKVYGIVNAGSPPHPIKAKRGRMLRFQLYYSSSTQPGSLSSRSNYKFGPWYRTKIVHHKGFPGRKFDEQVAEVITPGFVSDIEETFKAGIP